MADIVGVHPSDKRALSLRHDLVQSGGESTSPAVCEHAHPRISGKRASDRERVIGRSIVNEQDLQVLLCLAENAFNGFSQVTLLVVKRDSNRDEWLHESPKS
ncbi:MAG: hypothetical protein U0270_26315 [Labilithrix sp.]